MRNLSSVIQNAARISALTLQAMLEVVMSVIRLIGRLLGVRVQYPATPPMPHTTVEDIRDGLQDDIQSHRIHHNLMGLGPGATVYAYATAETEEARSSVDLDGLSDRQKAWVLALSSGELRKLAAAGATACQRAVEGRRSGVVGLPVLGGSTGEAHRESRQEKMCTSLRERILATRPVTRILG